MNVVRFYVKRVLLGIVNLLVGPSEWQSQQNFRRWLLSWIGMKIGAHSQISDSFYVYDGRRFSTGHHCRIGAFSKVWDFCPIEIGNNFLASHNLMLISASHETNPGRLNREGPIRIGDNVWIGANVTIVGPVIVGHGVVIGANSLVLEDILSNTIVAGIPARVIKVREHPCDETVAKGTV